MFFFPGHKNSGKKLLSHFDIRKALIVFQFNVVSRFMTLDQIGFQDECFHFRVSLNNFDIAYLGSQAPQFWIIGA